MPYKDPEVRKAKQKIYTDRWYLAHREQQIAKQKLWRENNREHKREYDRKYRLAHLEQAAARQRQRRAKAKVWKDIP